MQIAWKWIVLICVTHGLFAPATGNSLNIAPACSNQDSEVIIRPQDPPPLLSDFILILVLAAFVLSIWLSRRDAIRKQAEKS